MSRALPPGLAVYRAATRVLGPFAGPALSARARRGKEDPDRLAERRGEPGLPRPDGPLAWIHGASVGESLVSLALAEALRAARPDLDVLITSGTRTSAALVAGRAGPGIAHQFAPADRPAWAARFMDHWRPELAVFVESELWPNLILEAQARGARLALVNARMNQRSLDQWARFPASARRLLSAMDWIGAADRRTAEGLARLAGRDIPQPGNLKLDAPAPPPDADALASVARALAGRPAWTAASTHAGEEDALLDAHQRLLERRPEAVMILAPRHPDRAGEVGDLCRARGLAFARRSAGEAPGADTPVWLADTLGEMAVWFAAAPAAFIAGSLKPGVGGHNPIEATKAGAGVIAGPHVESFAEVYAAYRKASALREAETPEAIAQAVEAIWAAPGADLTRAAAALKSVSGGALAATRDALLPLLPERGS